MAETFESFMRQYGPADGRYQVIDVGEDIAQWPTVVVRFGDKTAVLQLCGVGADGDGDGDQPHLCIDIHAFVGDRLARAAVFGMENGKRYEAFDDTAPGTSHGWPAVQGVSVLIGTQPPATTGNDPRQRRHPRSAYHNGGERPAGRAAEPTNRGDRGHGRSVTRCVAPVSAAALAKPERGHRVRSSRTPR